MSTTYTKLQSSITTSTIWAEDHPTRIVWITMLAMADKLGRVWGSVPGLAYVSRVTVDECRIALDKFLSPDPDSRSKELEGRRIQEIDGGWKLVNHNKIRGMRDHEAILESKRKYINARRAKERARREDVDKKVDNVDICRTESNKSRPIASPSQDGDAADWLPPPSKSCASALGFANEGTANGNGGSPVEKTGTSFGEGDEKKAPEVKKPPKEKKPKKVKAEKPAGPNIWKLWIDVSRSRSLPDPAPIGVDLTAAKTLGVAVPDLEELEYCMKQYLGDSDKYIAASGHPLRDLLKRINKYREKWFDRKKAQEHEARMLPGSSVPYYDDPNWLKELEPELEQMLKEADAERAAEEAKQKEQAKVTTC